MQGPCPHERDPVARDRRLGVLREQLADSESRALRDDVPDQSAGEVDQQRLHRADPVVSRFRKTSFSPTSWSFLAPSTRSP